jgi:hypothetical protein
MEALAEPHQGETERMIYEIYIPRERLGLPRDVEAAIANSRPGAEMPAVSLVRIADALESCADSLSRIADALEEEDE